MRGNNNNNNNNNNHQLQNIERKIWLYYSLNSKRQI
jgi:hypothetical protein